MYSRGSVVGNASIIGIKISPSPSLNFHRGQKVRNLASLLTVLEFEPPAFKNAAKYPNAKKISLADRPMPFPIFVKLGPRRTVR